MLRWTLSLALLLSPIPSALAGELAELVTQRLQLMPEVAAYKWQHRLPIEHLTREQAVIEAATLAGLQHRLNREHTADFFRSQIAAAKEIQRYWFDHWQTNPTLAPTQAPDLHNQVRPQLLLLGKQITAHLGNPDPALAEIHVEGLSTQTALELQRSAARVTRYPDTLTQVQRSGVLRVGTTADYPPFTAIDAAGTRQGIDVTLARKLASHLGVNLHWVPTSWPTLMRDFGSGAFDIGMSGISITAQRQQVAGFSQPYHRGGKTPIVRCSDKQQLDSLSAIDRPEVTLVVNPGGTNQRYVDHSIEHAQVVVHNDNRSIFNEIISGRADAMITDAIEVALQSALHPELCAAMPGQTLTLQDKGFLLPQDDSWRAAVDHWLAELKNSGELEQVFARHLTAQKNTP
jgi:cyclohexadienyl dehydratase